MSRINTNSPSLLAQNVLAQQNQALNTSLERLSTGLQINTGADNPAGLIASQSLGSEITSINAAIGNAQSANQVVSIANGGLQQVSNLLQQVQSLVGQSANQAGISDQEKQANQLQVDSILQTINRIAATTDFQGTKLLNGTYDFNVTNQSNKVQDYQINAASLPFNGTRPVQIVVTNSAHHGTLFLSFASSSLNTGGATFNFDLAGATGTRSFTFASSTKLSAVAASVNTFTTITGVSAVVQSGRYLKVKSTDFGSNQFVSFKLDAATTQAGGVIFGSATNENVHSNVGGNATAFTALNNPVRNAGVDLGAIINGIQATAAGRVTSVNTDSLNLSLTLSASAAQHLGIFNAFTITGGGANFNLGPAVNVLNGVSLGIKNVSANNLGDVTDGYLSSLGSGNTNNVVNGNLTTAQNVVNAAINQVSSLQGRIGAFQKNVVGATISSLNVALENTTAAQSSIQDTNFASETANLTRSQILVSAATQVLTIANSQPQNVLKLLQSA